MKVVVFWADQQTEVFVEKKEMTGFSLIENIGKEIGFSVVALEHNGQVFDLHSSLQDVCDGGKIVLLSRDDRLSLDVLRHTTAHLMAYAISNIFPNVDFAIGPVIQDGFYYDVDFGDHVLKDEDFKSIEQEMRKLSSQKHLVEREEVSKEKALAFFVDNRYKKEIIEQLPEDKPISFYKMGDFVDLCRGPHLVDIAPIRAFKLQKIAGAYWRAKSNEKMLTRIYGTVFWTKEQLKQYLQMLEEAKKRDHNKLGREMKLFITDQKVGQGLPLLTERGTTFLNILSNYVEKEEKKKGYRRTLTPYLAKSDLYKVSGHWDHYRDGMFVIDGEHGEFALRPMTCPFHFSLYNSERRSYRELPIRYAETSTLFRNEASGEMHGLIRVRQFTLSDGHIICREDQLEEEFNACLDLLSSILDTIGLDDYHYRFSKWDPKDVSGKYVDDPESWDYVQKKMKKILDKKNFNYVEVEGEAAFYGPKLDVQMKNVYGKEDTILTVQMDFVQPKRFDMTYVDESDNLKRPYVIHRASIGCYERTMAMLIEKYGGKVPFWMAVDQVAILPISQQVHEYAREIYEKLISKDIRATLDLRSESLGKKIKMNSVFRIPIMLTIGEEEKKSNTVSFKTFNGEVKKAINSDDFVDHCLDMNSKKSKNFSF